MHDHNGINQAFHFFSNISVNILFKKPKPVVDTYQKELTSNTSSSVSLEDPEDEDFSPFTSRSNSNITINSLLLPEEDGEKYAEEPWRLSIKENIQYQNDEYFFMDRREYKSNIAEQERDMHGFKRPTQWIQNKHLQQFDIYYKPILAEQKISWTSMINKFDGQYPPLNDVNLKKIVRKGIPSKSRGKTWLHYSGAKAKMERNPELYQSLVSTANSMGDHNEYAEIIQRDLHRTFPDNIKFACTQLTKEDGSISLLSPDANSKLHSLRSILLAFSIHSPQIGYCQSLNYLAGFFLLFVDTEEEAFWMLVATVHDYLPESMYDATMAGANMDQAVLAMMVKERLDSETWSKICSSHDTSPLLMTMVTSHWFLTMFINILPIETVLRVWDCFFIEGYNVMFRVALTIIYMNRERIRQLQDPIEIFQILQNMPRRLIDCATFIDYVFSEKNLFAAIDQEQINAKRNLFKQQKSNSC